jgi:hypothetical protein
VRDIDESRTSGTASRLERLRFAIMRVNRPRPLLANDGADPVKVEAELYDALYGQRTGTVENIAPVADDAPLAQERAAS